MTASHATHQGQPLRFCMVTTFYPPYSFGGDGIAVQRLSRALVARGHHVTVIHDVDAYRALSPHGEPSVADGADGVEVVPLESGLGSLSPALTQQTGRPLLNRRAIRRIFERKAFHVINYHNISLVGGPGVLALGRAVKVFTASEHWLVCPTHVLFRHRREPCPGRQCLRCTLAYRRPPQLWRYTGYLERQLRHVDAFIALSEFSRNKHREFGFPREMEVVPNFLPDETFSESTAGEGPPHERPYFLFVGRLERIKGLDDVIPLFHTYRSADLLIAGDGEHGQALRRIAAGAPGVRFLGHVSQQALPRYYRNALALIMPSAGYETFGATVIEAFGRSTPVLARRIGPLPELVERSGGGMVFDSAPELLAAMKRLQSDDGLRRRMGDAAGRGFQEHWSESAVLPQYLNVVTRATPSARREAVS
jgi:glycosyltransferase involved in cell wall biosynthesis